MGNSQLLKLITWFKVSECRQRMCEGACLNVAYVSMHAVVCVSGGVSACARVCVRGIIKVESELLPNLC